MDGNPIFTGHLRRLKEEFLRGRGRATKAQRSAGKAMLTRLESSHDGTEDGVMVHVPWEEWYGFCAVVDAPA